MCIIMMWEVGEREYLKIQLTFAFVQNFTHLFLGSFTEFTLRFKAGRKLDSA